MKNGYCFWSKSLRSEDNHKYFVIGLNINFDEHAIIPTTLSYSTALWKFNLCVAMIVTNQAYNILL